MSWCDIVQSQEVLMKIKIIHNPNLEDEVVLEYRELTPAIEAAIIRLQSLEIDVIERGSERKLSIDKVIFFESEEERVVAHTIDRHYLTRYKLYELESILPSFFLRTSKSTIVNTLEVESFERMFSGSLNLYFFNSEKNGYCSRLYSGNLKRKLLERGLK